jgi:hypothetical protein
VPYATLDDVEAAYEGAVPDRAQNVLDTAHVMLDAIVADIPGRLALTEDDDDYATLRLDAAVVKVVVVEAVMRRLRNPKGYTSERDGDYGYSYGRPGSASDRKTPRSTWFTDEELALLAPRGWATVGTIDLVPALPGMSEARARYTRREDTWRDETASYLTDREDVP